MATPPPHRRPCAEAAGAGDARRDRRAAAAPPPRRPMQRPGRPAAPRQHVDRRILTQVLILAAIALVMLGLLVLEVARGTIGLAWAAAGLLAGGALGVVASRIRRLEWDERADRVVARLDGIGAVILAGYLGAMLARDWVLGHWAQGAALAALGLSVTAGVMAGRALGTRRGVRAVLRAVGLLAPADPAAAPAAPSAPDRPEPDDDGSTGNSDQRAPDDAAAERAGGTPRRADAIDAAAPHTPAP